MFTLSLITVICATENNIHSYNTAMNQLASNPNSENIEIAQPRNEIPQHDFNYIPNDNTQSLFNTNSFEDDKIESILNTLFFSLVKRNLSFILYNISILREIFAHINNMAQVSQLNMQNLKDLLFSSSSLFKVHVMRQIFEMNYPIEEEQQNYLIKCCKGYLSVYNINYDGLSLLELKEKVYASNPFFRLNYYIFAFEHSKINTQISELLWGPLDTRASEKTFFLLNLCYSIHDTVLAFYSIIHRKSIDTQLYTFLTDESTLFSWAFKIVSDLLTSTISLSFCEGNSSFFYFYDFQISASFIFSLYNIIQTNKLEGIFWHDLFTSLQNESLDTAKNPISNSILKNVIISALTDIFIEFLNESTNKRIELKKIERNIKLVDSWNEFGSIVHKFLKNLIIVAKLSFPNPGI